MKTITFLQFMFLLASLWFYPIITPVLSDLGDVVWLLANGYASPRFGVAARFIATFVIVLSIWIGGFIIRSIGVL